MDKKNPYVNLGLFWFMVIIIVIFLLSSCRTSRVVEQQPVPIESVRTDTVRVTDYRQDSIYICDSVIIRMAGDTVYRDRWRTEYRDRIMFRDSILIFRDTIRVPVTITREVEVRHTPPLVRALAIIGTVCLVALALFLVGRFRRT